MTITAQIVLDSIGPDRQRLTTFRLSYPRFIHAEFMTHRMFSRNASSSRAIPVKRMIEMVKNDPATFVFWGSNKPGMQAGQELTGIKKWWVKTLWGFGCFMALLIARMMTWGGAHKQIINRILEPWGHITVLVTASNYTNFFALRAHPDAQPEIHALAVQMQELYLNSIPKPLANNEWHLPFVSDEEQASLSLSDAIACSVARSARVSYLTFDGKQPSIEKDLELYKKLVGSVPLHASPAEHQANPDSKKVRGKGWATPEQHGNLEGWIQYRKLLPDECK